MKLLVKDPNFNLIWRDAVYKDKRFRLSDGTVSYDVCEIYAVKDDDRNKIVICSACGAEIQNTPASIRAHKHMVNQANKCFGCGYLKTSSEKLLSQKFVLNDDGTYAESTKRNVRLRCGVNWNRYDINSDDARHCCKYARCENATFKPVDDFWTKYPNAFDELIAVDKIVDSGYLKMYRYSNHINFALHERPNISATVNNQGVCCCFKLIHRQNGYELRYSKKYDKVWALYNGRFVELSTLDIAERTERSILNKLRTLYE